MPLLRRRAADDLCRSRHNSDGEFVRVARTGGKDGAVLSALRLCLRNCHLVQLAAFESPQAIFGDYVYFSSFSESWLRHAKGYVQSAAARFALGPNSLVVEVASNNGYLLQYFRARGIPVLGVDPAANVAEQAVAKGIPTEVAFFGSETARIAAQEGLRPNLMVANNVLAHVPNFTISSRGSVSSWGPMAWRPSSSRICCASCRRTSSTRSTTSISPTSRLRWSRRCSPIAG